MSKQNNIEEVQNNIPEENEDWSDFSEMHKNDSRCDWRFDLVVDDHDQFKTTLPNLELILENDPELINLGKLDTAKNKMVIEGRLPWSREKLTDEQEAGREFSDVDLGYLWSFLQKKYGMDNLKRNLVEQAVSNHFHSKTFSSIVDRLDSLEWDGIERLDQMFQTCLGATDSEYMRAVSRKTMCALVARAYEPGIKWQYVPVIQGKQGIGKSTFLTNLVYWDTSLFCDSVTNINDLKKVIEVVRSCWIVEFAELVALERSTSNTSKNFITQVVDTVRFAYKHSAETVKRQWIIIGTVNDHSFLKDPTGDRRYWPIDAHPPVDGSSPIEHLNNVMSPEYVDQLWAEARMRYMFGEELALSQELEKEANTIRCSYTVEDTRMDNILAYLEMKLPYDWEAKTIADRIDYLKNPLGDNEPGMREREYVCVDEIWEEALDNTGKTIPRNEAVRIGEILKNNGWEKSGEMLSVPQYGRKRVYRRVTHP